MQVLKELNLDHLIPNFEREDIDINVCMGLTEEQLIRLGVKTIGERPRLNSRVRSELRETDRDNVDSAVKAKSEGAAVNTPSCSSSLLNQRNLLFGRGKKLQKRKSGVTDNAYNRPKKKKNTWTVTVVCLAEKNAKNVPTPLEKEKLFRAGLGPRKIQFLSDDTEADVLRKIACSESSLMDRTDCKGFPQLQDCGGFELLQCRQNSRTLTLIECEWSVKSLKTFLGYQAKIYVRPIQKNLSIEPIDTISESDSEKMQCQNCSQTFFIRELRGHINSCGNDLKSCTSDTDGEELPDPGLYCHVSYELSSPDDFNNNVKVHDAIIYVQDAMPQSCINTESGEVHIVVDPTPSSVSEGSHHVVIRNSPENTQSVMVHKAPEMDYLLNAEKDKLEISQNILYSNSTNTCMSEK